MTASPALMLDRVELKTLAKMLSFSFENSLNIELMLIFSGSSAKSDG